MLNPQNLIPARTKEEARRRGANGGKKSGEARRRKKLLRDLMIEFGALEMPEGELKASMAQAGLDDDELTYDMALVIGQYQSAVKGNPASAIFIRDTRGEKPVDKSESTIIAPKPLVDLTKRKKNGQ